MKNKFNKIGALSSSHTPSGIEEEQTSDQEQDKSPGVWKKFEVWSFYCPISNQLMDDPVISKYGHIYNRKSI